jgi:hypothetical protein
MGSLESRVRSLQDAYRLVLEGMSAATIMANARRVTRRLGLPGMSFLFAPERMAGAESCCR